MLWVADRIRAEAPDLELTFAVDHELLAEVLIPGGYKTIMTRDDHQSGTDRIAEANRTVKAERVINVQADEPLVTGAQIRLLAELIAGPADMATLGCRFSAAEDFRNPNQVKVVCDRAGRALYFSRAPIPYPRDQSGEPDDRWVVDNPCFKHLGLYAYKAAFLEEFAKLPPGRLESIERLEQLRALENGKTIAVGVTKDATIGVDVPEDAAKFAAHLALGAS